MHEIFFANYESQWSGTWLRVTAWCRNSGNLWPVIRGRNLLADLIAGVTVGLVALPLAMAFAISSGVKPEAGIYTAIVAGFIVSALGGSRCQIAGPTGAFVVIVAGIVTKFGVPGSVDVHDDGRRDAGAHGHYGVGLGR